jgi:hypothetical protein
MDNEQINAIFDQYPWATESTLDMVNSEVTENNVTMANIAAILGDSSQADIQNLQRKAEKASDSAEKTESKVLRASKVGQTALDKIISGADPVNAVAELSHEVAKLLANAGVGISKYTKGIRGIGAAVSATTKVIGTGMVITTGMAVVFAKLLTEQEKQTRQLVDFGAVVADQGLWTSLRSSTRKLGMGLKSYTEMAEGAKSVIISSEGDAYLGQMKLSEFIQQIDQSEWFNDFGFSIQDQSRFITQETETLYQLGQITSLNAAAKQRVMESYKSANKLALFTGNSLGVQRTEALRMREEARNNIDLQTGLIQNAAFITSEYGEVGAKNIADASGFLKVLNESTFGADWAKSFEEHVAGTVGDISFDQSAVNNIDTAFLEKMRMVGPGVAEAYIQLVQDTATGEITSETEAVARQRELVALVKKQVTRVSAYNPLIADANMLIAQAKLIPDSYFKADISELNSATLYAELTENADHNIDVLDDVSVTFQNIQEILTPGFDTMGTGFRALAGGMLDFGQGLANMLPGASGRFNELVVSKEKERMDFFIGTVTSDNIDATIKLNQMKTKDLNEEIAMIVDVLKDNKIPMGLGYENEGEAFTEDQRNTLSSQLEQYEIDLLGLQDQANALADKAEELNRVNVGAL